MNIEEATEILEEAVITEPSIKSFVYISANEINEAIGVILQELQRKDEKIKALNKIVEENKEESKKSIAVDFLEKIGRAILLEKSI